MEALHTRWLSLPEVADALEVRLRDVRTMLAERRLVAVRQGPNDAWSVPADLLTVGEGDAGRVLASLRGTLIQLADAGLTDSECVIWLFSEDAELGERPIDALRSGRTHAVRRAAQPLAF
ncbi:Rv2175c family DNA-binding protein [Ruania rhizosphaerae]|uniref:Rv2175c family DNA-binding protein n=1 Tax=Ruania rhizosphaerae TaxID=1840413 RepID=UPI00135AC382|nr:Rv2175c family DNA-binding protein [Ruania rhizosphaerae]